MRANGVHQVSHSRGFFGTLGNFVASFRWLVLAAWIVLVGISVLGARQVKGELISGGINAPGSESDRGQVILADEFDRRPVKTAAAIFTSQKFIYTDPEFMNGAKEALDRVQGVDGVNRIRSVYNTGLERLVSPDKHTTYAVVELNGTEEEAKALIPKIRDELHRDLSANIDQSYILGFP